MPSNIHPQAMFDPMPPDLDLSALVEKTPNFDYVIRISTDQIKELGLHEFEKLVLLHVIQGGKPLVVEGWESELPPWLYSSTWLRENMGKKQENVRDIPNYANIPMTIGHYLNSLEKLTRQWTPENFRDPKRQRLYLKDIDCPEAWDRQLRECIPEILLYLNNCIGEKGGPGSLHVRDKYNHLVVGQGIAPAGDLMSNLPPEMRAQNMMCYIGHEGTYTPAHREMCATLGQNLMVETSDVDKGEKPGSSIWFMTETKDREVVSEYFLSMLGHDIEVENHFAQIVAWKKAPFPVYIVEQKVGDFILIPPLAPHQVWNRGTRTMKVAWNRTTVETLEMALYEALPRARMVCRDEQYKCKAIVFYSLLKYYNELQKAEKEEESSFGRNQSIPVRQAPRVRQLQRDFKRLFSLYRMVLVSEMFSPELPKEKHVEYIPFDSNITCSYCRCNIFNRFLTCKTCIGELENGDEDTYDICMDCYAMGRSCGCLSNLQWVEQWQWPELTKRYDVWRGMVLYIDGYVDDTSPQPLEVERKRTGKKGIAHICQEQLKKRPWRDISKPLALEPLPGDSDVEPETDDRGRAKKKSPTKRQSQEAKKQSYNCHICKKLEAKWKLAFCTTCPNAYCYGTLWRAFDIKPEKMMETLDWQCPKCLQICSCGACRRRDSKQVPYQPKGTLLGHDTRRVADPRSVESLVDFSRTNLAWLKGEEDTAPQNSVRMQKLMEKAQAEKSRDEALEVDPTVDNHAEMDTIQPLGGEYSSGHSVIDPALRPDGDEGHVISPRAPTAPNRSKDTNLGEHNPVVRRDLGPSLNANELFEANHRHQHSTPAFVSPADLMKESDNSAYPDLTNIPRERMMGIGYYQQRNDADKILFDAPDPSAFAGEQPDNTYPRLRSESEDRLLVRPNTKRLRENVPSGKGRLDEAYLQFLAAQKKQKLNEAKKNGKYFMTKNILDGGKPYKIKMSLPNHKEFLAKLEVLGEDNAAPRYNPRPARTSLPKKDVVEYDSTIVTSDLRKGKYDVVDLEDSTEELEMNTIVPINRVARFSSTRFQVDASPTHEEQDSVEELKINTIVPIERVGRFSSTRFPVNAAPDNGEGGIEARQKKLIRQPSKVRLVGSDIPVNGVNNTEKTKRGPGRVRKSDIAKPVLTDDGINVTGNQNRGPDRPQKTQLVEPVSPENGIRSMGNQKTGPGRLRKSSVGEDNFNKRRRSLEDGETEAAPTRPEKRRRASDLMERNGSEASSRILVDPVECERRFATKHIESKNRPPSSRPSQPQIILEAKAMSDKIEPNSRTQRDDNWNMDGSSERPQSSPSGQSELASNAAGSYNLESSDDAEEDFVLVDENYDAIPAANTNSNSGISSAYHNAKMEALHIAEAELEAVAAKANDSHTALHLSSERPQKEVLATTRHVNAKPRPMTPVIHRAVKDSRYMSLSERRAAQGKKAVIVTSKSRQSFSDLTAAKQTVMSEATLQPAVEVPRMTEQERRGYSTATSSDADDDEEIPARKSVVKGGPRGLVASLRLGSSTGGRPRGRPKND